MNKELKDYTETELKSIAYDALLTIERLQSNLKVINQELANRMTVPQKEKTDDKPKKKTV